MNEPSSNTQDGNRRLRVGDRVRHRNDVRHTRMGPVGYIKEIRNNLPLVRWDNGTESVYHPYDLVFAFVPGDGVQLRADIQQIGMVKAIGEGFSNEGQIVVRWNNDESASQGTVYQPTTEAIEPYREPNPLCGRRDCIAVAEHRHIESDADICATCDGRGCPVCSPEPEDPKKIRRELKESVAQAYNDELVEADQVFDQMKRSTEKLYPGGLVQPSQRPRLPRAPLSTLLSQLAREATNEHKNITAAVNASYRLLDELALPPEAQHPNSIKAAATLLHDALRPVSDYRTNQITGT